VNDDHGAATTEVVLVFPLTLFLVLGVFQFALWYHARAVATAAAQEGVAAGRVEGGDVGAARDGADRFLVRAQPATVVAERRDDTVVVAVEASVVPVVPGFALAVRARSEAPVERFVPTGSRP
jgi:Flp pilus assembly protein TadG